MAELFTFEVVVKFLFLRTFFVFLVPPWGLPLYPFTPNDPKNEKYIAIPFICHPGDCSVLENDWVIHIWSDSKIFIFEEGQMDGQKNGWTNGRTWQENDSFSFKTVVYNYQYVRFCRCVIILDASEMQYRILNNRTKQKYYYQTSIRYIIIKITMVDILAFFADSRSFLRLFSKIG